MSEQGQDHGGSPSADVIATIEAALTALRRDARRRGPWGQHGPWEAAPGHGPHGAWPPRGGWPGPHGADRPQGDPTGRGAARGRDAALGRMARFRMLEALEAADSAGRALSVSTLAAAIGVDQPRASRLVQEGVERGHVRRVPDPSDARRALLELTAAGRSQLSEVRSHRRSAVEAALAEFTPDEAQTFATLLTRFARSWPHP